MSIPKQFHFIFGLREQTEPFHLLHWLCLTSCLQVNQLNTVHFYYHHEPFGHWWDRIRPRLTLHRVTGVPAGFAPQRYADSREGRIIQELGIDYAHEADFLRLEILLEQGGIYADMDTLFVRPYPQAWYEHEFVIGEEYSPIVAGETMRASLCNAVMLAQPGSRFVEVWRETMNATFDGRWNSHSCRQAASLWQQHPFDLTVLPSACFYRYGSSPEGLYSLLEDSDSDRSDLYSIHLWAHLWWSRARNDVSNISADMIDEDWILNTPCTLARLARPFLQSKDKPLAPADDV